MENFEELTDHELELKMQEAWTRYSKVKLFSTDRDQAERQLSIFLDLEKEWFKRTNRYKK